MRLRVGSHGLSLKNEVAQHRGRVLLPPLARTVNPSSPGTAAEFDVSVSGTFADPFAGIVIEEAMLTDSVGIPCTERVYVTGLAEGLVRLTV